MFWFLAIVLLGWLVGGVVNYLSDFLPVDRTLVMPYCLGCRKPVGIVSYIFAQARCANCGRSRTIRSYIVNFFFIVLTLALWYFPSPDLGLFLSVLVCLYFGVVVVVDLEHRLILHPVSLGGAVIGLWLGIVQHGVIATLIGGLAGFLMMFLLFQGGRLFVRILIRWRDYSDIDEALGFGDVILGGVIGLMLGWPGIVIGLILAVVLAGIVSLFYLLILFLSRHYRSNVTIAYGPYLVVSAFSLLFLKDLISSLF